MDLWFIYKKVIFMKNVLGVIFVILVLVGCIFVLMGKVI